MRRTIGTLVAGLLALGAAFGLVPAHAASWTPSSYASRLVQLVNQARQQHGLSALTVTSGTSEVAAAWTAHLDATQTLAHNPDLQHQLETHGSPNWTTYGENVGQGPSDDPDGLFKAYMASTEHRDNILNGAFRFTGVSVILDGKSAWNTFDFVDSYESTSHSSTTVKPKPAPTAVHVAPAPTSRPVPVATSVASSAAPVPTHVRHVQARHPRHARPAARPLPHTGARAQADAMPDLGLLLGSQQPRTAVLGASVRSLPVPPRSKELSIGLAGLLLGFIAVRWWQVARAA